MASLSEVFSLSGNPLALVIAAAFGLAPERIIGPLQQQTERLKDQFKAGKATAQESPSSKSTGSAQS
jgi:hypothetical protein